MSDHIQNEEPKIDEIKMGDFLQDELTRVTAEATDFKDKYYRSLAEMENTRKRLQQDKKEMITYAIDNMLGEMLSPLDNLEMALSYADNQSAEVKNWAHGFKMILAQFKEVLQNHGVVPFDSVGHPFDPHFHEAIEVEESDTHPENSIISESIKGYRHGERVLRPARVKVAKKAGSPTGALSSAEESPANEINQGE